MTNEKKGVMIRTKDRVSFWLTDVAAGNPVCGKITRINVIDKKFQIELEHAIYFSGKKNDPYRKGELIWIYAPDAKEIDILQPRDE